MQYTNDFPEARRQGPRTQLSLRALFILVTLAAVLVWTTTLIGRTIRGYLDEVTSTHSRLHSIRQEAVQILNQPSTSVRQSLQPSNSGAPSRTESSGRKSRKPDVRRGTRTKTAGVHSNRAVERPNGNRGGTP